MNEYVKKIEELGREKFLIKCSDRLSSEDWYRIHEINDEIKALEEKLKDYEGYAVKLKFKEYPHSKGFYKGLFGLYGDQPTLFESEDEALACLNEEDKRDCDYQVIKMKFGGN